MTVSANARVKVETIRVVGLQRLSEAAVLNQLPIQAQHWFDPTQSSTILKKLYATKWFEEVQLVNQGAQLEIVVKERPTIYQITIQEGHGIPTEHLEAVLNSLGLKSGEFFDATNLELFRKMLVEQLARQGYQSANVQASVNIAAEGKTSIEVSILLGPILRFGHIDFIGNQRFSKKHLYSALPVGTCRAWSVDFIWAALTNKLTQCTQETRDKALAALRLFYENQGHLDIKVKTRKLTVTPNRREADWTIELIEGPIYKVGNYRLLGNINELDSNKLHASIQLSSNTPYSKQTLVDTEQTIKKYFDALGYKEATVTIVPHIDRDKQTISFAIEVNRGERIYVRHIDIASNYHTQDQLFRSLMVQQEASIVSEKALEDSKQALLGSGLVQDVNIVTVPVPGVKDQVDVKIHIQEIPNKISINPSLSYNENGLSLIADTKLPNRLGTGEDIKFKISKVIKDFSLDFGYHKKVSNIFGFLGASWSLEGYAKSHNSNWSSKSIDAVIGYFRDFTSAQDKHEKSKSVKEEITHPKDLQGTKMIQHYKYQTDSNGGRFDFNFPKDSFGRSLQIGAEFKTRHLYLPGQDGKVTEVEDFFSQYGSTIDQWILHGGLHTNRLSASHSFLPIQGEQSSLNFTLALSGAGNPSKQTLREHLAIWSNKKHPLNYWKVDYQGFRLWPIMPSTALGHSFAIQWHIGLGQQLSTVDSNLPFFDNYHSGRFLGFKHNSLGPKSTEAGYALGGNLLIKTRAVHYLPKPFQGDALPIGSLPFPYRLSLFCQAGNVYDDANSILTSVREGNFRSSYALSYGVALEVDCRLPLMGPIPLFASISWPVLDKLATHEGEHVEYFNMGLSFLSD